MSRDEGGVWTVSSNVRLVRASLAGGVLGAARRAWPLVPVATWAVCRGATATLVVFLRIAAFFGRPAAFGRAETGRLADRAVLARTARAGRLVLGRFTERFTERRALAFRVVLALVALRPARRLAIFKSFQNLDSFAISVVLSAAYRHSARVDVRRANRAFQS
jgi:hypothetical protein